MSLTILQFDVGQSACAFAVQDVVEVVRIVALTRVPNTHAALAGVVNLHGLVLPVLDLRACLHEPRQPFDVETRIVIVPLTGAASAERRLGLIVDRVNDVETIVAPAEVPGALPGAAANHVAKIIQGVGRLIMVLDARTLVTPELSDSIGLAWAAQRRGEHAA